MSTLFLLIGEEVFGIFEISHDGNVSKGAGVQASVCVEIRQIKIFYTRRNYARKKYEEIYKSEGIKYGELKKKLAGAICAELEPIQKRREELKKDIDFVDGVIKEGAEKARKIAHRTLLETKEKMGLL